MRMNNSNYRSFQLFLGEDNTLKFKFDVHNVKSLAYEMFSFANINGA